MLLAEEAGPALDLHLAAAVCRGSGILGFNNHLVEFRIFSMLNENGELLLCSPRGWNTDIHAARVGLTTAHAVNQMFGMLTPHK